jgi:hypothetical protein
LLALVFSKHQGVGEFDVVRFFLAQKNSPVPTFWDRTNLTKLSLDAWRKGQTHLKPLQT